MSLLLHRFKTMSRNALPWLLIPCLLANTPGPLHCEASQPDSSVLFTSEALSLSAGFALNPLLDRIKCWWTNVPESPYFSHPRFALAVQGAEQPRRLWESENVSWMVVFSKSVRRSLSLKEWEHLDQLPKETLRWLISKVGEATDTPDSFVSAEHLRRKFAFVKNRTLTKLMLFFARDPQRGNVEQAVWMRQQLDIPVRTEDVIRMIVNDRKFLWKYVPDEVQAELLQRLADEIGIPASVLLYVDFLYPAKFLEGRKLASLYETWFRRGETPVAATLQQRLHQLGFDPTVHDLLVVARHPTRKVLWENYSWRVIAAFLDIVATDLRLPLQDLTESVLRRPIPVLNGNKLSGFIDFALHHPEKPKDMPALHFVKMKASRVRKPLRSKNSRYLSSRKALNPFLVPEHVLFQRGRQQPFNPKNIDRLFEALTPVWLAIRVEYPNSISFHQFKSEAREILLDEVRQERMQVKQFKTAAMHLVLIRWLDRMHVSAEDRLNASSSGVMLNVKIPEGSTSVLGEILHKVQQTYRTPEQGQRIITWVDLNGHTQAVVDYKSTLRLNSQAHIKIQLSRKLYTSA